MRHFVVCLTSLFAIACATSVDPGTTTGSGNGGSGSGGEPSTTGPAGTGGSGGAPGPCVTAEDCTSFTDACNTGTCINGSCAKMPANEGMACDDGKNCTLSDECVAGVCTSATLQPCGSSNPCMVGTCDIDTDQCVEVPGNDGVNCDDDDPCTQTSVCQGGACAAGQLTDCSFLDGACSVGSCDPQLGCVPMAVNNGTPCDDGFFCTVSDACNNGLCTGAPNTCAPPGDVCMIGSCNEIAKTCVAVPGNDGAACDDANDCTTGETCSNGSCIGGVPANQGLACDDGNGCTGGTTCSAGNCTNAQSQIVACINGDSCCPAACTVANDDDCGFIFALTQTIDGMVVTCSSVDNNATYAQCNDLKAGGLYFPNGVTCGPMWDTTNSVYSDTVGFCMSLTGSPQIEVFYTCDVSQPRATWFNHAWGTFDDNGYTQHVRCYH